MMVGTITLVAFSLNIGLVLPKPQFSFNPSLSVQNCGFSQCNQNNIGGGGGGFYRPPNRPSNFFQPTFSSFSPSFNQQNCFFGQCNQNNFRRRTFRTIRRGKREAGIESVTTKRESGSETSVYSVECGGAGLAGSSCVNSLCLISCTDGVVHNVDCQGKPSRVSSPLPQSDGKVVVTVSCGEKLPACYPFCFGWGRR